MKVLVFTTTYPNNIWPNHGVFVKERMSSLARIDGCQLKVIAPVPYYPPVKIGSRWLYSQVSRRETIEGVEVYHPRYFMVPKVGMTSYGLMMFLSAFQTAKRIQKEFDFDIISAHTVYPDGFAGVLLGHFLKKPVVVSARGSDINLLSTFPLVRKLLRYTLSRADGVISVCQALKDTMIGLETPGEKITVIPNGVDSDKFRPIPKGEARKQLGLPNKRIILSVGELIPRKGFDLLIKALKILSDEYHEKDLYLVIVGEGKFRGELEQLVASLHLSDHVRLVGVVPHRELYLWYSAADLFCLASNREGWPNVVMESLACGTPVVATDVWGVPEIIQSDTLGLLTKRSEREIAEKIAAALKKNWKSDEIVRYAREHTWDQVARSVLRVLKSASDGDLKKEGNG